MNKRHETTRSAPPSSRKPSDPSGLARWRGHPPDGNAWRRSGVAKYHETLPSRPRSLLRGRSRPDPCAAAGARQPTCAVNLPLSQGDASLAVFVFVFVFRIVLGL